MLVRHNVFISYHHDRNGNYSYWSKRDFEYRDDFERMCSREFNILVSKAVQDGDIASSSSSDNTHRIIRDKYLRDSTVTVVLIGNETWKRKHVDWEISSSLRQTAYNSRNGLIGILLPTHQDYSKGQFYKNNIPQRLAMNIDNGFAKIYDWSNNPYEIQQWIYEAFQRRDKINPDNSLEMFTRNR